jgi:hypothetical protein
MMRRSKYSATLEGAQWRPQLQQDKKSAGDNNHIMAARQNSACSSESSMGVDILNAVSAALMCNCSRQRSAYTYCCVFHPRLEDGEVLVLKTVQ